MKVQILFDRVNHFHLLVRVKEESEIGFIPVKSKSPEGRKDTSGIANLSVSLRPESVLKPKKYKPENQFSHLFNAYTKAFNKRYQRTGSLFEHPFKRIKITSPAHLKYLIYYIHHNPIHHGFCDHYLDYPWSSYLTILSPKQTRLKRDEVLNWFNDTDSFRKFHSRQSIEKFEELQLDIPY